MADLLQSLTEVSSKSAELESRLQSIETKVEQHSEPQTVENAQENKNLILDDTEQIKESMAEGEESLKPAYQNEESGNDQAQGEEEEISYQEIEEYLSRALSDSPSDAWSWKLEPQGGLILIFSTLAYYITIKPFWDILLFFNSLYPFIL